MKIKDIKIGGKYNDIVVLENLGHTKRHGRYYGCMCVRCGVKFRLRADHIGKTIACKDCIAKGRIIDLSGLRFGRLIAISYEGRVNNRTLWKCKCDCGQETIVGYSVLVNGGTRSCGCLESENRIAMIDKHRKEFTKSISPSFEYYGRLKEHPLWSTWNSMIARCSNPNTLSYKNYGGRGIRVCERWLPLNMGFENFVKDMGNKPSPEYTLDRINVNGNYEPSNCRWASVAQQQSNKRTNSFLYYRGNRTTVKEFCDANGLKYFTIIYNVKRGVDINYLIQQYLVLKRGRLPRGSTKSYINYNTRINGDYQVALGNIKEEH